MRKTQRSGAHYYMIGDRSGSFAGLECSATRSALLQENFGTITHCNHPLAAEIDALNAANMAIANRRMVMYC